MDSLTEHLLAPGLGWDSSAPSGPSHSPPATSPRASRWTPRRWSWSSTPSRRWGSAAAVLPRFRARAAALGLGERVDTVAGDWGEVTPEGRFDRVVLANVLHLEPGAAARALLLRAAGWLAPGGDLVVLDHFPNTAADALAGAFYALHLGMRTRTGRVHALADVTAWCADAGLPRVALLRAEAMPSAGAVWARAPE